MTRHSPADTGNILVNDEIIAVNGEPVTDFNSLILAVNAHAAGETIRLKIRRFEDVLERTLVLSKYPVDGEVIFTNRPPSWRGLRVDYLTPINYRVFGMPFDEPSSAGVVVVEVEEGSPAASAGLKKGQLVRRAPRAGPW